jgi:hypothetical protein
VRNILVFPGDIHHNFMYPENREIKAGDKLQVELKDNRIDVLTIIKIEKTEKEIYYYLSY